MAYPSPRKTPRKRKNSGGTRTAKRARTRTTRGFRVRRVTINVKEDQEFYSKSYYKQPVTAQQQKIINKRFKNGFSPFKDFIESRFQLNDDNGIDKAKWIWRCIPSLNYILKMWKTFPDPAGTQAPGTEVTTNSNVYKISQDQAIYINKIGYRDEIYNPTNYDMNLVIYDIIYKNDTEYQVKNGYYESTSDKVNVSNTETQNPIALMQAGISQSLARYTPTSTTNAAIVADPNAKTIQDITLKPTESYPFNIHCKIVKKHTYRLQPGSSMVHKFIHKPKCLLNRGYFGYRYAKSLNAIESSSSGSTTTYSEANTRDIGVKDVTSGCLFKVWGCVTSTSNAGSGNHNQVVN
ncbi:hypothetical protein PIROE2DRAFT_9347 [Piromyces sp. E2]|nr:hypothetical protein PIROE2DRAFT_9347 [Piromyces sp. E2]|eukprot:OUM64035.1 hypothetical protein PIROE2DRAFT_9347 [Piromyces sp. E2]